MLVVSCFFLIDLKCSFIGSLNLDIALMLKRKHLFLQDLYVSYQNAINQSSEIQITDRYRYSELDVNQTGDEIGSKEYAENFLQGSYRNQLNEKNSINISGDLSLVKTIMIQINTIKHEILIVINISGVISRNLDRDKHSVSLGYILSDHQIKNNAGGIQSGTLFLGLDRIFNPQFMGSVQFGIH